MEQKQAIADRLKQANNILVTVSNNPTVDQLSSCIGLTLALNKMGKHATAVFSGSVPSTIEFLQPEKTIEKNTDSLRDFIIALDKAKADKLRYKVEDKVVKIFITPYKTSITDKDLQFSQGDFNVDVVIAIGVHSQTDLDQAITSHGRILHDATVATVNTKPGGELGTINWLDPAASSLSELIAELVDMLDPKLMDGQMATAMLTGIVAETERFSNEKTTPTTMSVSAVLMSAGANQQLVATKLQEPVAPPPAPAAPKDEHSTPKLQEPHEESSHTAEDGTLEIAHQNRDEPGTEEHHDDHPEGSGEQHQEEHHDEPPKQEEPAHIDQAPWQPEPEHREEGQLSEPPKEEHWEPPKVSEQAPEPPAPQINIDEEGTLGLPPLPPQTPAHINNHSNESLLSTTDPTQHMASSHMILEPPAINGGDMGGASANSDEERPAGEPLQLPSPEGFGSAGNSMFAPSASANITSPTMPYLPPSMTPGVGPATPPPVTPPSPATGPAAAPFMTPSAQVVTPTTPPPAPAPASVAPLEPQVFVGSGGPSGPSLPPLSAPEPAAPAGETLSQIEAEVQSPHLGPSEAPAPSMDLGVPNVPAPQNVAPTIMPPAPEPAAPAPAPAPSDAPSSDLASARNAVMQAIAGTEPASQAPEPIAALNAQPLGAPLHDAAPSPAAPVMDATANPTFTLPDAPPPTMPAGAPPATPPPMMPPGSFGQ
jgi:hypothetical protein